MNKNDIVVIYGDDVITMTKKILSHTRIEKLIGSPTSRIGLKPNLAVAKEASSGATTHPEILEGIIQYLQERSFHNISIIEGSWVGDRTERAFDVCGYSDLAQKYRVDLIDTQKDTTTVYDCAGMQIAICDTAMAVDFMINIPVLKGHCQTSVTCALKNNKGVIPNSEKRRFHAEGLHRPIAHLNVKAKNDFILVDSICGDLNFEEGGNPVQTNRLFATLDPVLCDSYVCSLMGYSIIEVPYIPLSAKLGIGQSDIKKALIHELNKPSVICNTVPERRAAQLAEIVSEKNACSACYASLIHALERINENGNYRSIPPLSIGQGYKGVEGVYGIGSCTNCFKNYVEGCPPTGEEVLAFLERIC